MSTMRSSCGSCASAATWSAMALIPGSGVSSTPPWAGVVPDDSEHGPDAPTIRVAALVSHIVRCFGMPSFRWRSSAQGVAVPAACH
jgi:hypothetical protein